MPVKYIIQLPDFSTEEDHSPVDLGGAMKIIADAPWEDMACEQDKIEEEQGESCPYNIIFYDDGENFQVFKEQGSFSIHCSVKSTGKKILGFLIPHIDMSNYVTGLTTTQVESLLNLFIERRYPDLISKMEK